jgi:protein-tyrosine-phosphatase/predicted ATP-grasp superfamily ATP-dependent carboligase
MSDAPKVLIGFGNALSAPEVIWSLTDSGFVVSAFVKSGTRTAIEKSRFVDVEFVTDPAESIERALADLQGVVRKLNNPILMALDDEALWLIDELSNSIDVRVAGATGERARMALDKRLQLEAARNAGFAIPDTQPIETASDLQQIRRFPVILKPALAAREFSGRLGRGKSHVIGDTDALAALGRNTDFDEVMLAQPLLNGVGEGLFGLASADGVVCWSSHRRVRMMNPMGSGSSACTSLKPDPDLCVPAERFVKSIGWRGMFMIELLRDRYGKVWFMELNGRSWGSMALARRMGFEYPAWTARQFLDPHFTPVEPPEKPPVLCRHLGRELVHLAFVLRGPKSRAVRNWPSRVASFASVLRFRLNDCWYSYNKLDRKVFWAETWRTLSGYLPAFSSLYDRPLERISIPFVRWQQARVRASGRILKTIDASKHILFLCYGNINRSALAEQHLRQIAGPRLQVSSCGFHVPSGRPLDSMMRTLSREHGIVFDRWSSKTISRDLVAKSDLIFVMEARHLVRLSSEYPDARARAFLLSCVSKPGTIPLEIRDPAGKTPEAYRQCIQEITKATSSIAERLKS